jgi:membrane AbrB-like protein
MAIAIRNRTKTLNVLETLAIGTAGGALFLWANLPGGLTTGAMLAVGIAAIAGRPLAVPPILTQTVLVLLGISLGSLVSRQLLQHMGTYPLTQIIVLAAEKGADVPAIAVVQTLRVIVLTAALPLLLAVTGMAPSSAPTATVATASPLELAELIAASVAAALLLRLIKFPASWMFGAMIGSMLLHGTGVTEGGLPAWVRGIALVGIGALIGTRFARMNAKILLGHVNAALGSFAIAIAISAGFVAVIALTTHVRFADIIVAFAPGAMDAMLALALTLHIDPIFVGAHHLSRFVFVTIATPGIVHLFGRPQEDVDD